MIRYVHAITTESRSKMKNKKEETKKQAVPVMRQLARPISKEELRAVSGAVTNPAYSGGCDGNIDYLN
jgi:hypothetical protein